MILITDEHRDYVNRGGRAVPIELLHRPLVALDAHLPLVGTEDPALEPTDHGDESVNEVEIASA